MNQKIAHLEHQQKKKERDIKKQKDKITSLLKSSSRPGEKVEVLNATSKQIDNKNRIWKHGNKRNENKQYKDIVAAFEDEKQELIMETENLKKMLSVYFKQLLILRKIVFGRKENSFSQILEKLSSDISISESQFDLPFKYSKYSISDALDAKVREIKKVLEELEKEDGEVNGFIDKFEKVNEIILKSIRDEKEYHETSSVLQKFNERVFYLRDLLSHHKMLLSLDYMIIEAREEHENDKDDVLPDDDDIIFSNVSEIATPTKKSDTEINLSPLNKDI